MELRRSTTIGSRNLRKQHQKELRPTKKAQDQRRMGPPRSRGRRQGRVRGAEPQPRDFRRRPLEGSPSPRAPLDGGGWRGEDSGRDRSG